MLVVVAPTVALASAWQRHRKIQALEWVVLSALLVAILACLPLTNLPLLSYLRSLSGDLSIPSILLLARVVLRHLGVLDRGSATLNADGCCLRTLVLIAAVILYPLSLDISQNYPALHAVFNPQFDPWRWGFSNPWLLAVLLVLAMLAWHRRWHWSAAAITLAVLAHALGWNESSNLWTYLVDPMVAVYALFSVGLGLLRKARFGWASLALLLTGLAWLFLGLLQREPWKADEAYSFGVVYSMIDNGQWLIPTLAGEAFVEKPPLVFWLAAWCAQAFGAVLAPHEAARLANVVVVLLTFGLLALGARRLGLGRAGMITVVLLLMATPSWLFFSRYLTADLGLFPGAAMASLGLVGLLRRDRDAGVLLGLAGAIGLMSKGLLLPAALAGSVLLLLAFNASAREAGAWKQYGIASGVFVIAGFVWPLALYADSPALFEVWFWDNNFGRFLGDNRLGPPNDRWLLLAALLASFLPIWPLALVAVYRKGWALRQNPLLGPLLFALNWIAILLASHSARSGYALPALVPLALLAAAALDAPSDAFKRKVLDARAMRWLILSLAGAALLVIVAAKIYYRYERPDTALGSSLISNPTLILIAVLLLAWALAFKGGYRPRLLTLWVSAMSLAFALAIALFLPGADQKTGFRGLFAELSRHVNPHAGCIASRGLGESERGMLHYYTGVQTLRVEVNAAGAAACPQSIEQQRRVDDASQYGCKGATQIWSGGRQENTFDVFRVCRR